MKHLINNLLCVFLLISASISAQTNEEIREMKIRTNVRELRKISERNRIQQEGNYSKAIQYAKINGWPLSVATPFGIKILRGISADLKPLYNLSQNLGAGITARADKLYSSGNLGLSVHGESMSAGVWDQQPVRSTHEAFENRAIQIDIPPAGPTPTLWHPSHVSGTIIASDQYKSGAIRGMAYKGNVRAFDWINDLGEIGNEASNGLLLSNHSYIAETINGDYFTGAYGFYARTLDEIMHNAPYYLSVWCAGNAGGPADKLGTSSGHKNGIAVGGTIEVLNYTGPSSVFPLDAPSTSRGPTDDGRIKPDISAKGKSVYSIGGDINNNHIMTDHTYITSSGTSMATASITGTLLLLQQHYINLHPLKFMRASTLKGLALHSADEAGPYPGPDITFGWGLINAEKAANTITNNGGVSYISEDSLATGGLYTRELVASGSEPLVATICWTDLPGTPTAIDNDPTPKLVNDLDLRVISNGTTYYPWKLDLSNVTGPAIQGDNNRDNIEKIEILNPVAGQVYTLRVNYKGTLAENGQRFSVIITGLEECVVNRNIASSVNTISVDHQQASATILATNTVNTGAEAVYHAGDQVLMTDGFTAVNGSVYRAYIEACSNDYAARKGTVERPVVTYNIPHSDEEIILTDDAVYPNPGNGIFNVKVAGLHEGTVKVINLSGKEFINKKFKDQQELNIDIKNEAPGMYIIRVVSGSKVYTKTIMKF